MKRSFLHRGIALLWSALMSAGSVAAQQSNRPSPRADTFGRDGHLYIGADYYPEHWPRERWETDIRLMREAGFNVVRLAEFSWGFIEPSEGVYRFDWLDQALALLDRNGIKAILGTPTASMPAWVARKYPEVLAVQSNGQRYTWGSRKDYSLSSGTYRLLSQQITRAMAEHFAATPNVIGWQTDNEFAGPQDFSETSRIDFQDWLRRNYGTLETLNRSWGTHFWGHLIGDWAEVTIPDCVGEGMWGVSGNPSACLDWRRFNSWINARFQADQVAILRAANPDWVITHNLMGLNPTIDYYELARDLDLVSWDNYPALDRSGQPYAASMAADLMRGLKRKNFWIMEQTAGAMGWATFTDTPLPGELRNICYQQLAHGADAQIWFRWRTATAGREQYWHGLLGHDGRPLRRYREAAQVTREYRSLEPYLKGTTVKADVAIVYDYESIWSLASQPGYAGNDYTSAVSRYYNALFRAGISVDLISPEADLTQYQLVLAPDLVVLPDARARRLIAFVERGGVLMTDIRTGVKDENNLAHERTLPGLLSDVLGITIEEYGALEGRSYPVVSKELFGDTLTATHYVDWVTPTKADAVAAYGRWPLESFAAVTRNQAGRGIAWYVGTVFEEDAFYDRLIDRLLNDARVERWVHLPEGVEASVRQGAGRKLAFLINHNQAEKSVTIPSGKRELLTGEVLGDRVRLGPFGVAVIEW
ncbi:MAG: beta-galactosidase [Gemmatimonadetes bacterium]|nr:beta-galactosidase [Gemmatimonadota bacterium]